MVQKAKFALRENHLAGLAEARGIAGSKAEPIADIVEQIVSRGRAQLERKQYGDALDNFELALYLDPDHKGAQLGRNRVRRKLIPRWHFEMLNDTERNDAFELALSKAITPDTVVLDIGSGSGLLAMMAARAGAKETISCEMVATIAEIARATVELNGYSESVVIVEKKSIDMSVPADMPRRANLLVTETVDCGLLGEGIVPSVMHAREHLLTRDAVIIPCSARLVGMLVESDKLFHLNWAHRAAGFDVTPINEYQTGGYFPVRLGAFKYEALTEPFELFRFDFTSGSVQPEVRDILAPIVRDGACHGIVFWFEMQLDDRISMSNCPGSNTHWEQAFQCLSSGLPVRGGEEIVIRAEHDCLTVSFDLISGH